jgi:hypothetical protein
VSEAWGSPSFARMHKAEPYATCPQLSAQGDSGRDLDGAAWLGLGGGPGQHFFFNLWPDLLPGDFEVVGDLKIQPILRRCAEIAG